MSNPYNNLETFNNDIIKKKYKINRKNTEFPENEKKVDRFAKTAHFGKSFIGLNELMNNFPKGNNIDSLIAMNEISKGEPVYLNVYHINVNDNQNIESLILMQKSQHIQKHENTKKNTIFHLNWNLLLMLIWLQYKTKKKC